MTTATAKTPTARGLKIGELAGQTLYACTTGLKLGSRGKVRPAGEVYAGLSKGAARRLRKALHRAGKVALAAAPRS